GSAGMSISSRAAATCSGGRALSPDLTAGRCGAKPGTRHPARSAGHRNPARGSYSVDQEVDPHVDTPLADLAGVVGDHLDVVDPGTADVLDAVVGLVKAALHRILDALVGR